FKATECNFYKKKFFKKVTFVEAVTASRQLFYYYPYPAGVYVLSTNLFREYHYVSSPKTWAEAQRYCRETYANLATVDSPEESDSLLQKVQEPEKFAWMSLFDNTANWKWVIGDEDFNPEDFSNWKNGEPNTLEIRRHFSQGAEEEDVSVNASCVCVRFL
uniref:C-type lectin domain-containing protein n=1 Tax=Poecilia reticulata TaxID=8081 RepID=A0A3P9PUU1_POERE